MNWGGPIGAILGIIEKVIPDPKAAAEAKLRALELNQRGDLAELDALVRMSEGQMAVNKAEAESGSLFRGGWRPAVGWTCVFGLVFTYVARPLLPWTVALFGVSVPPLPSIDTNELFVLLLGMLGLGGMRTLERVKGKK